MTRLRICFLLSIVLSCSGSGHAPDHAAPPADGGDHVTDGGGGTHATDAGRMVGAGPRDAGRHDAGPPIDAGSRDAGLADTGVHDSGAPAAGPRLHGLEERIESTTCFLNGSPPLDVVPIGISPAFASLKASGAVSLIRNGSQLALVEKTGRIRTFAANSNGSKTKTVLDLGSGVRTDGLRGAAFRPDGKVLLASYLPAGDTNIVLARFDVGSDGTADLNSEEVLLTVALKDDARAGGALAFLFDGTLVAAFGDGGDAAAASDTSTLVGKLARIDVSASSGYAVPPDNPFATDAMAHHALFALGLGAPTSCTVDRVTGHLWCADAGDASNDHVLLLLPGAMLTPILSYKRVGCGAVVGFVSRDAMLPDIQGALVFGDACSATLQALRFDGSLVRSQADSATLPASLSAFGEDADGRMLAVDADGDLHALVRPATSAPEFPTSVSATGCIADMATRTPAASLVPFEVRTPLWSDGAKKHRFIIMPGLEKIGFTETGAWDFPVGTMFMKEFLLDDDDDATTENPIMETRFLIKRSDTAWEGYSYMWDRERKDAFLLEGAEIGSYAMQQGSVDSSGASVHRHTFPDRAQCLLCHNAASGRALGLQTGRMNTDHDYDGFVENQLQAMAYIGLFTKKLPAKPDDLARFAEPADETADLEARARSWLYANCSHCHRPGGPTPVTLDFRYETPLADVHACGVVPQVTLGALPSAKIIDPGHSDNSEMFYRLSHREAVQMPPIATLIVDPTGVDAVQHWIDDRLEACP